MCDAAPSQPSQAVTKPEAPNQDNFFVVEKQTLGMFVLTEFFVYLSQVAMFFLVAVLTSNFLRDEQRLISYMNSKINVDTGCEIVATMIAIAATVGIISGITKAAPKSSLLERVADEVLAEAPRTAYVFGSGVAGTLLAAALFLRYHPHPQGPQTAYVVAVAVLWALVGFVYGCCFSYAFKHKSQIKSAVATQSKNVI